jgi:hypothetical protein
MILTMKDSSNSTYLLGDFAIDGFQLTDKVLDFT